MASYDVDEEGQAIYNPDDDWEQEQEQEEPEPYSNDSDAETSSKPRKRLVKKADAEDDRNAKRKYLEETSKMRRKSMEAEKPQRQRGGKDREVNEMWNSVAGVDSEDDKEGTRTNDDDAFIDDTGVEPAYYDDDGFAADAPQAEDEDDDDLKKYFKSGKRQKVAERSAEEITMVVEHFIAKLEIAAEDDAELNRQSKPAINKLKLLPTLVSVLEKRQFQNEFIERGVLTSLKNWLEPLPDGSLPNMNIRTAILKLLTDLPIDLEIDERRDSLKQSGLGKVVMFLSKLDEETPANKKLAKDLVDKWSRPLFQKSTRYECLRNNNDDEEKPLPPPRKTPKKQRRSSGDDDDLMDERPQELKPGQAGYRSHASRPEAVAMDFVVRPQSKVDMVELNSRSKQSKMDDRRTKMNKRLQQLRTPKKKKLQAERISVEGRGLVKFY